MGSRMKNNKDGLSDLWMKAAVVGGLWASLEIIVGSFLHNTRLPFAGTILAFVATILLIGFYQIWPQRGLIIRAGMITAIMKSVSPSAIILGPITGILLEAALIEIIIMILGNNLFGLSLAGIFSVSSALFHKLISLFIFYGFDLIRIYVNIVNYALKQFHVQEARPVEILIALLAVYSLFGIIAAWLGYYIGLKSLHLSKQNTFFEKGQDAIAQKEFFEIREDQKTSTILLIVHLLSVPVGLVLLNINYATIGFVFIGLYILIFGYRYRTALRRLKKPLFWSQLIVILILSALFWDIGNPGGKWFSMEGFYIGVEMVIRALFIVVAFSSISVELHNKKVRNFLFNIGFGHFYQSVSMAFGALPIMISSLPRSKEIIRYPVKSLLKPLVMADEWLKIFREEF